MITIHRSPSLQDVHPGLPGDVAVLPHLRGADPQDAALAEHPAGPRAAERRLQAGAGPLPEYVDENI